MNQNDGNLKVGGGVAPAGLTGTLEDDERALKKGKGKMMAGMIVAGVLALGAVVMFMMPKADEEYRVYGRNINGLRATHFDGFWACALEGARMDSIANNQDLQKELNVRGLQGKGRWATHVHEQCLPKLAELQDQLKILMPPEDLAEGTNKLHDAVKELRSAWTDYNGYLGGLGGDPYDATAADAQVMRILRAWYDYRRTHNELNDILKEKIKS